MKRNVNSGNYRFETLQVHAGQVVDGDTLSRAVPIYQTTAYLFRSAEHGADLFALREAGNMYTRLTNPTTDVLEKRVAALEGAIGAVAVASGHSAQFIALASLMRQGDNIVSSPFLYGGTWNQFTNTLPNFGMDCRMASRLEPIDFEVLIDERTKAIYVESISNANFSVPDFERLAEVAHGHGIPLIVDNTFGAGGYLCRPLDWGADIVVESATKWIGGHGTSMGGIICDAGRMDWGNGKFPGVAGPSKSYNGLDLWEAFGPAAFLVKCRAESLRDLGPAISPMNSFLILEGAETLSLRVQRAAENAMELARWFVKHPGVRSVCYPGLEDHPSYGEAKKYLRNGFGCVMSVDVDGTKEDATALVEALTLVSHLSNVGDNKTLITQPAATTHAQLPPEALEAAGIGGTTLRISVGIEHIDDLKADFDAAFEAIKK